MKSSGISNFPSFFIVGTSLAEVEDLSKLTVAQLKDMLKEKGLKVALQPPWKSDENELEMLRMKPIHLAYCT